MLFYVIAYAVHMVYLSSQYMYVSGPYLLMLRHQSTGVVEAPSNRTRKIRGLFSGISFELGHNFLHF